MKLTTLNVLSVEIESEQNSRPVAASEVVALTAGRKLTSSPLAGDDFGFFLCLPLAVSGGLAGWAVILWFFL